MEPEGGRHLGTGRDNLRGTVSARAPRWSSTITAPLQATWSAPVNLHVPGSWPDTDDHQPDFYDASGPRDTAEIGKHLAGGMNGNGPRLQADDAVRADTCLLLCPLYGAPFAAIVAVCGEHRVRARRSSCPGPRSGPPGAPRPRCRANPRQSSAAAHRHPRVPPRWPGRRSVHSKAVILLELLDRSLRDRPEDAVNLLVGESPPDEKVLGPLTVGPVAPSEIVGGVGMFGSDHRCPEA